MLYHAVFIHVLIYFKSLPAFQKKRWINSKNNFLLVWSLYTVKFKVSISNRTPLGGLTGRAPEFLKTFDSLILYIYVCVCVWAFLWPRSLTEMVIGPESSLEYQKERPKMKNLQQCANTTTCINIPHFGRSTFYVLLHPSRSLCILLHPCFHLPSETFRYQTTFCPNKPFGGTHHLQGQCVSTSFKAWRQRF